MKLHSIFNSFKALAPFEFDRRLIADRFKKRYYCAKWDAVENSCKDFKELPQTFQSLRAFI